MEEIILKECPFCFGEAEFKKSVIYKDECVAVWCKVCHKRSTPVLYNAPYTIYQGVKGAIFTEEGAKKQAAAEWNSRSSLQFIKTRSKTINNCTIDEKLEKEAMKMFCE